MILIISEQCDTSTDVVCDWLNHFGEKYIRVNLEECILNGLNIQLTSKYDMDFSSKSFSLKYSEIKSVWFRRGYLKFFIPNIKNSYLPSSLAQEVNIELRNNLFEEHTTLFGFIYSKLMELPHLGNPHLYNINKLIVLDKAIKAGLNLPNTIITTSKDTLDEFSNNEIGLTGYCATRLM
jgi:hypothetical protein